jgi:3-hydroxyacyl-CoA dehydrogenase/enoyl-CoA hydratase/3-hydroxybutyryl-CoA epimerase
MVNEAVRCLEEEILRSPRDGDGGAVLGLGFPPFLGGPFPLVDRLGARYASELLERLEGRHGERFRPAELLRETARRGGTFQR